MKQWWMCTIQYAKENEEGLLKKVNEKYLVNAVSFTDAEATIHAELSSIIRGDFNIANISKSNITDVVDRGGFTWHQCKLNYTLVDETSGKAKKVTHYAAIESVDIQEAYLLAKESMKNSLVTHNIVEVKQLPIQGIIGKG
jgi:hypothetical protein